MVAQLHDTGNTSTDWMCMYADDPVTGTSVMYWMDGSTLKGSVAEQVEPLGQRVEVTDPEVWVNEPTNYENQVLNSASDPEWQCTVQGRYQTFMDMPDHCQRKILESFDRGLDEVFGFAHLETYKINVGPKAFKISGALTDVSHEFVQKLLGVSHKPSSGSGTPSAVVGSGACPPDPAPCEVRGKPFPDSAIPNDIQQRLDVAFLNEKKDTAIRNAFEELTGRLEKGLLSDDCQKNVLDKLATVDGFDVKKFVDFLKKGADFYDGEKSTAQMSQFDPTGNWKISVAKRFKVTDGLHAFVAKGTDRLTIFFDPGSIKERRGKSILTGEKLGGLTANNLAFLFHEALHGFGVDNGKLSGNYDDEALQKLFYGEIRAGGSVVISDYIKEHCFD